MGRGGPARGGITKGQSAFHKNRSIHLRNRLMRIPSLMLTLASIASFPGLTGCVSAPSAAGEERADRAKALLGTRATYCGAPRTSEGRVDVDRLIAELVEIRANTYSFCIHSASTDWDDLKRILPRAGEKGIRVWASIVPPSESPPRSKAYAEPF